MSDASGLRMLRQSPQLLLELEIECFPAETVIIFCPTGHRVTWRHLEIEQTMDLDVFFVVMRLPPGHPLASQAKVWLPFRPESLLSRALEGVVGTAAAFVSQKHHSR